jgi:hypothetical protein
VIVASTLFLIAGIVTFVIGVFSSEGLSMIIVSIAASALAALTLFVGVMRDRKRVVVEPGGAAPMPTFTSEAPAIESIPEGAHERTESPSASALPPIEMPAMEQREPVEASPFGDEDEEPFGDEEEDIVAPTETASMRAARLSRERFAPAEHAVPPSSAKPAPRRAAAKKAAPKTAAKKTAAKKGAPRKQAPKKPAPKKPAPKKAAAKATTTKKAAPKKTTTKKAAPKKTAAKKDAPKKTTAKKSSPKKS